MMTGCLFVRRVAGLPSPVYFQEFLMSQNCCAPVDDDQREVRLNRESCCAPVSVDKDRKLATAQTNRCPTCGQKGKKVDSLTLKAMLNVSLLAVCHVSYLFCRTTNCPVVYFAADGLQVFTKDQIRVPVHQKEPADDNVPICYCFCHSPATIGAELLAMGRSTAIEEIEARIKAGQCACEIRNPQGSCCLGNVSAIVKRFTAAIPASLNPLPSPHNHCHSDQRNDCAE
jgi:hypothetical protein